MIDAHTHLSDQKLLHDWRWYVDKFVCLGWKALVTVSIDQDSFEKNILICHEAEEEDFECLIKTSVWIHPYEVVAWHIKPERFVDTIIRMQDCYRDYGQHIVCIGECGVDLHYEWGDLCLQDQQTLLAYHCQLATELWLPVMIHSRDAFEETLAVVQDFPDLPIYFHCWGYDVASLSRVLEGFSSVFVWFCGNVTYKKATELRDCLIEIPLEHLLLETDAPYLAPQCVRGSINHPALVSHLYEFVAEGRKISLKSLSQHMYDNFIRLYQL